MYGNGILLKYDKYTNVLTGYEFMLPCMWFMHLALLDHSMPDYVSRVLTIKSMVCPEYCIVLKSHIQARTK